MLIVHYGIAITIENDEVIEELMEIKNLVCLNDGNGTRIDIRNGKKSAMDLTLVSETMAGICTWEIVKETILGSDHYPIITEVGVRLEDYDTGGVDRWVFSSVDWENLSRLVIRKWKKLMLVKMLMNQMN